MQIVLTDLLQLPPVQWGPVSTLAHIMQKKDQINRFAHKTNTWSIRANFTTGR